MAKEYIDEIKKIQPNGPYIIGGECLGGIAAYEIAQQLTKVGDEVALLILMDTYKPDKLFELKYKFFEIRHILITILRDNIRGLLNQKFTYIKNKLIELPKLIAFFRRVVLPLSRNDINLRRVYLGSYIYAHKLIKYRPKPYKGEVIVMINDEWNKKKPNLGWNSKYFKNIIMKIIPGDNTTRLTIHGETYGKILADNINKGHDKYC